MIYNELSQQDIPKGWEVKSFTKVINLKGGGTPSTEVKEYWNGNIPFFTPKDISSSIYVFATEKNITEKGLNKSSSRLYPTNTIFVTARGTVGEVAMAGISMAMNQSCYAVLADDKINQYYAYQLTIDVLNKLKHEAIGAVFKALVTKDFDGVLVCEPSFKILQEFHTKTESIYKLLSNKQKENILFSELKTLLLSRMASKQPEAVG